MFCYQLLITFLKNFTGCIYINQHSVADSDIYEIFPRLFHKRLPKRLPGFKDFLAKISSMGLNHLIDVQRNHKEDKEEAANNLTDTSGTGSSAAKQFDQWWYIGE